MSMVKSWDKQGAIARLEASYLHAEEQEEAAWELETVSMSMRFLRIIIEALGQMMPGGRYQSLQKRNSTPSPHLLS